MDKIKVLTFAGAGVGVLIAGIAVVAGVVGFAAAEGDGVAGFAATVVDGVGAALVSF